MAWWRVIVVPWAASVWAKLANYNWVHGERIELWGEAHLHRRLNRGSNLHRTREAKYPLVKLNIKLFILYLKCYPYMKHLINTIKFILIKVK